VRLRVVVRLLVLDPPPTHAEYEDPHDYAHVHAHEEE
jgi:hypothetical protein